jgi:hypothetical protein
MDNPEAYIGTLVIEDRMVKMLDGISYECPDCNWHYIVSDEYGDVSRPFDAVWCIPLVDIMNIEEYMRYHNGFLQSRKCFRDKGITRHIRQVWGDSDGK